MISMETYNTPAAAFKMISIAEAQQIVLQQAQALPALLCDLAGACGSVLAQDVQAPEAVPPFPASIKDGYAVIASDGPGEYVVAFDVHAGNAGGKLQPGSVAYIATGGPVPEGADAVVQIENTKQLPAKADGEKRVHIVKGASRPGEDIRPVGSDIQAGQLVLPAGELLGAAEIGILATVGAAQVQVHQKPCVAVASTGDEVVEPWVPQLAPGQIRDANRAMLLAAARQAGAQVIDLGIARDHQGQLEGLLQRAITAGTDVLLTSGGVSMGHKDFVKPLLERHGQVHFGKVLMKPGKPLTFATVQCPAGPDRSEPRKMLVFGLPGNPVSSIVTFNLVVLPAIRRLAGWQCPLLRRVHARVTQDLALDPQRPEYHRATLHWSSAGQDGQQAAGEFAAESTGGQISSRLLSMRSANALLELPRSDGILQAGSMVSALLIGDLAQMPVSAADS